MISPIEPTEVTRITQYNHKGIAIDAMNVRHAPNELHIATYDILLDRCVSVSYEQAYI